MLGKQCFWLFFDKKCNLDKDQNYWGICTLYTMHMISVLCTLNTCTLHT